MDMQNVWRRNADRRKQWTDKQLSDNREAETAKVAFNHEVDTAIGVLMPYINNLVIALEDRDGATDPETLALLSSYCETETIFLQLMKERRYNKTRQTRYK